MNTENCLGPAPAGAMLTCLEAVRIERPDLIADNAPPGWGMLRFRAALENASQK